MSLDPPTSADPTRRNLLILIAATTLVRLVMAGLLDLGPDESYALAVGRTFQWSFFDHPPLAFWTVGLMEAVFGRELPPILARLPFVLMFAASTWAMSRLTARAFGSRAGLWAAGLLNVTPFFFVSAGSWIVPDGPLVLSLLLAALCLSVALDAEGQGAWRPWFGAGLFAGLALLSKYQAAVVIAGVLILLLTPSNRRWLARPQPYMAGLIALGLFAPVLWWNATNLWISFAFQLGRGSGLPHIDTQHAATMILGEALYLLPWTLFALLIAAFVTRSPKAGFFVWLGLPLIVLFNGLAFFQSNGLPHWSMPGWLFLFPLLGTLAAAAAQRGRRWPAILAGASTISLAALLVAGVLIFSNWRILSGNADLDRALSESSSWTGLRDGLAAAGLLDRPNTFYAAMNWLEGARLDEAIRPASTVAVFGDDPRGFAFLGDLNARLGQDAVVAVKPAEAQAVAAFLAAHFQRVETLGSFVTLKGGKAAFSQTVLLAHGFTTPVEIPYGPGATVNIAP